MKVIPQGIEITEVDFAFPKKILFICKLLKEGDDEAPDHPETLFGKPILGNVRISCKNQCSFSFLLIYFFFVSRGLKPTVYATPCINF